MYASITESKDTKGDFGIEIGNSKETIVPWVALKEYDKSEHTLRDVILLLGFDTVGKWSLRNKVSRVLVRSVTGPKVVEPLDSPEPEKTEFLE